MVSIESLVHLTDRSIACPGSSSIACVWSGCNLSLLMAKVTPADTLGLSGFVDEWRAIRLPKGWCMSVTCWWSKCVSWRHSILICFRCISLWTSVHLEIWLCAVVFEWDLLFMLRVATRMLAYNFLWLVGGCSGSGHCWGRAVVLSSVLSVFCVVCVVCGPGSGGGRASFPSCWLDGCQGGLECCGSVCWGWSVGGVFSHCWFVLGMGMLACGPVPCVAEPPTVVTCWGLLRLLLFLDLPFLRLPHTVPLYYWKGVFIAFVLSSPRTYISTDRLSCADYVVPLTHCFHYFLSHSTITHPSD